MTDHTPQQHASDDRTRQFMELFSKNEQRVKIYILALLPNWSDADDVFAETNIRLWEQFDANNPVKDFGAWACTVAHYQVLSRRKHLGRDRTILNDSFLDAVSASVPATLEQSDHRLHALRTCLEKLVDRHRRLIQDVYAGSQSIAQVAESLGKTPAALSMQLTRIRYKLHSCIESRLHAEDQS